MSGSEEGFSDRLVRLKASLTDKREGRPQSKDVEEPTTVRCTASRSLSIPQSAASGKTGLYKTYDVVSRALTSEPDQGTRYARSPYQDRPFETLQREI